MRPSIRVGAVVLILSALLTGLCSAARAQATAEQYYQAGLQLYQAKDYAKAVQYFDAALKVDPNMGKAAQGAGNCYMAQNQSAQALPYYEKALALNPGDAQLATFVQNLKAQVGAAPAAAAPATGGSYAQGKALFDAKQYAQAQPLLQQAVSENPLDANAHFYLGYCQYVAADKRGAALSFARSSRISPNATADSYAQRIRAMLTPEEAAWVDAELAKPTPAPGAAGAAAAAPVKKHSFGIRLVPGLQMFTLGDLKKDSDAMLVLAADYQSGVTMDLYGTAVTIMDESIGLEGKIAKGGLGFALEPFVPLGNSAELGMHLEMLSVSNYEVTITNSQEGTSLFTHTRDMKISAMPLGLSGRFLFGNPGNKMRPFIGLSALYLMTSIDYTETYKIYDRLDLSLSGNMKGSGIGGGISLGVDFALGNTFKVSPFFAYRMLKAKNYKGTAVIGDASVNGELVTTNGNGGYPAGIVFMAEEGTTTDIAVPTEVDFGGLNAGLMIGLYF
jgi:tetratricopeptide (TPR) repeat protein